MNPTTDSSLRLIMVGILVGRDRASTATQLLLQYACTSMCRHIYDRNIVNCEVGQPIHLTIHLMARKPQTWKRTLKGHRHDWGQCLFTKII